MKPEQRKIIAVFELLDAAMFYGSRTKFKIGDIAKIAQEYPDAQYDIKMLTGKEGQGRYIMTFYESNAS
jgi:hypothetical protein